MARRSIWKGSITFGLITIPIKLYTAVGREQEKIDLHLLHEKDGTRIHYERQCEKGHRDVDWNEIVKGYEYQKGKWVTISDEELEALELDSLKTIDVVSFAPMEQIDPLYFEKSYYVVPEESAAKAYRLMVDALLDEQLVGVCKVAIRERERLATLRIKDEVMVLETMHWPEEVRDAKFDELNKRPKVQDRERKMARQLIQHLSDDFDPSQFKDEYHKALKKLIDKKVKGEDIVVTEEKKPADAQVVDLMEALRASVEAARQGKKPSAQTSSGSATKTTKKKSPARKTSAKKTSKKTSAKKSARSKAS
jgi:DNA end-binding protein Ku